MRLKRNSSLIVSTCGSHKRLKDKVSFTYKPHVLTFNEKLTKFLILSLNPNKFHYLCCFRLAVVTTRLLIQLKRKKKKS